eukprot:m.920083 g.920083  ORF g.920083 m.920083 type:complete len:356 (+) comp61084_c0_seq1:525-1592(+)
MNQNLVGLAAREEFGLRIEDELANDHDGLVLAVKAVSLSERLGRELGIGEVRLDERAEHSEALVRALVKVVRGSQGENLGRESLGTLANGILGDIITKVVIILATSTRRRGDGWGWLLAVRSFGILVLLLLLLVLFLVLVLVVRLGLGLGRRILEDVSSQLVAGFHWGLVATRSAAQADLLLLGLDAHVSLGVVAVGAEHISLDEAIKQDLQALGLVLAVHNVAIILDLNLRSKLAPEVLARVAGWASERLGDVNHVDNDSLDSISFAFDLGNDRGHLVSVELILNVSVEVNSHFEVCGWKRTCRQSVSGEMPEWVLDCKRQKQHMASTWSLCAYETRRLQCLVVEAYNGNKLSW